MSSDLAQWLGERRPLDFLWHPSPDASGGDVPDPSATPATSANVPDCAVADADGGRTAFQGSLCWRGVGLVGVPCKPCEACLAAVVTAQHRRLMGGHNSFSTS